MNATKRSDGQWRSVEARSLFKVQRAATEAYRAVLAERVQGLGYTIGQSNAAGAWELAGFSRAQVMAFSHRRQDVEQHLDAVGFRSPGAAAIAAQRTRMEKDGRGEAELRTEWRGRAREVGLDLDRLREQARGKERGEERNERTPAFAQSRGRNAVKEEHGREPARQWRHEDTTQEREQHREHEWHHEKQPAQQRERDHARDSGYALER
jgi:hypothetical protein